MAPSCSEPGGVPVSALLRVHLLVFPPTCRGCRALLSPLAGWGSVAPAGFPYLCAHCHAGLPWWPAGEAVPTVPGIDRIWAASRYEAPVSEWVRQFKFGRRDGLVRLLATLLLAAYPLLTVAGQGDAPSLPLVVPVPLHRRRLWWRGFNQALLLARAWSRLVERSTAVQAGPDRGRANDPLTVAGRVLVRHRHTPPQVRLGAEARRMNVADAFSLHRRLVLPGGSAQVAAAGVRMRAPLEAQAVARLEARLEAQPGAPLAGRTVLLVDDVVTTGATLSACAQVLRAAGAASVEALVVARA